MTELALKVINNCIEMQETLLNLGDCGLTNDDFKPGSILNATLRNCTHVMSLILNNERPDGYQKQEVVKKNPGPPNVFEYLPLTVTQMSNLRLLICTGSSTVSIKIEEADTFKNLNNLIYLDISRNPIRNLHVIKNLKKLSHLALNDTRINDLTPLENISNLNSLHLSSNRLENIAPIGKLSKLMQLHLSSNEINDLKDLKNLHNLEVLTLSYNQISTIEALENLLRLETLSLSHNNITDIKPLENLKQIKKLSLNYNQITNINSLEKLSHLEQLLISHNKIQNTAPISKLRSLKCINLSFNKITDIHSLLPFITRKPYALKILINNGYEKHNIEGTIQLTGNEITTPPIPIIAQGNAAILRYFEKIKKEGIDYLHEAKLTFVGEGSAGKTSLQKRLISTTAALPKEDTRTRGIQIIDWKYNGPQSQSHIAHIWDFGGQDVYYPVHRFFLTENSVFVLLASTRQNNHNFDYWIPTIFQFGGKSPIILGQTCHEGNKIAWNDIGHYLADPNFNIIKTSALPYTEINLLNNNEGLDNIKKEIINQIEKLPHYGKGVPKSWIPAREAIARQAFGHACISFEAFGILCKSTNTEKFSSNIDIEDFARFLHALGIVLWYHNVDELKKWVILQPEWAMNAVYKIIDDDTIQNQRGHIQAEDFDRIWNDPYYTQHFDILKKMLHVFKIAFPKKHNTKDFIIPARLLSIAKDKKWESNGSYLRLTYKYNFMPRGLVNQLSAHLSRHIASDKDVWNDAVNFTYEQSKAQVIEDFYNRTIYVYTTGKDARSLIVLIREAMQEVIESYKGVNPNIIVPCSCRYCKTNGQPTPFDYQKLLQWSAIKKTVTCNESDTQLLIDELLYNVALPSMNEEKIPNHMHNPLKAFISYSKFDGESAKDSINHLEAFKKHLAPLTGYNNLLQTWDDTRLIAGEEWDDRIKEELNTCDIIFLLISPDFLNTRYIKDTEITIALERHKKKECVVVPIVVKPCGWTDIPMLSKFSGVPRKGIPITSNQWSSIDEAWNHVYKQVKELIQHFADLRNTKLPIEN